MHQDIQHLRFGCTPMLAIAEAGGHSPPLAEAGEGHHLPGLGDLEGTSFSQGLTACKQNKQTNVHHYINMNPILLKALMFSLYFFVHPSPFYFMIVFCDCFVL